MRVGTVGREVVISVAAQRTPSSESKSSNDRASSAGISLQSEMSAGARAQNEIRRESVVGRDVCGERARGPVDHELRALSTI